MIVRSLAASVPNMAPSFFDVIASAIALPDRNLPAVARGPA
jgi:hypothetical protein